VSIESLGEVRVSYIPAPGVTVEGIEIAALRSISTVEIFRQGKTILSDVRRRISHWNSSTALFRDVRFHIPRRSFDPRRRLDELHSGGDYN
jgi:hypothetical protein